MIREYLITETYTDSGRVIVLYQDYDGQYFDEFKAGPTGDVYKSVVQGAAGLNAHIKELGPDVNVIGRG